MAQNLVFCVGRVLDPIPAHLWGCHSPSGPLQDITRPRGVPGTPQEGPNTSPRRKFRRFFWNGMTTRGGQLLTSSHALLPFIQFLKTSHALLQFSDFWNRQTCPIRITSHSISSFFRFLENLIGRPPKQLCHFSSFRNSVKSTVRNTSHAVLPFFRFPPLGTGAPVQG